MRNPFRRQENIYAGIAAVFVLCLILIPALVSAAPLSFEQAKVELRQKVYYDRHQGQGGDLYCGCDWRWVGRSGGRVEASSCGYRVRAQPTRGERIEWEHIVAASTFGRQRQCWQNGGRSNCTVSDPVFNIMEADMHNLTPVVGELNADRSNYNFGVLPGTPLQHGSCSFKVDNRQRTAEPPDSAKGKIARVNFYMHDRYGLNMSRQQQQQFMAWDKQFPVTEWELERNNRITQQMGHGNLAMAIKAELTYRFVKSGNLVRAVSPTNYGGRGNWRVVRIDSGKEMIVPGRALIDPNHPDWS